MSPIDGMTICGIFHIVIPMRTVSRTEIAECVEGAFAQGPLSPTDLIEFAADHGARSPVVQVLSRLDRPSYHELRDLWSELRDVPVDQ